MLPLWARVDLGAIAMKGYSAFPKAPAGTSPSDCLVSYPGHSFLPLCGEAVGVFYNPSRLGKQKLGIVYFANCSKIGKS